MSNNRRNFIKQSATLASAISIGGISKAEKIGMKVAMHPDDPQVDSTKGISRIMTTVPNFKRMLDIVKSQSNGITMCQ